MEWFCRLDLWVQGLIVIVVLAPATVYAADFLSELAYRALDRVLPDRHRLAPLAPPPPAAPEGR
jgi:hypothetical protein